MDPDSFKDYAKDMAEYITNYLENIRDRQVVALIKTSIDSESSLNNNLYIYCFICIIYYIILCFTYLV